ncbi:3-hydroxyacyl-[acyl-carrier-protein] dehydratase FabZ [Deltaproteobacteria bacterium]|nr:3-hydroxyacyl-[acyl-carrier-protein] dehydratase FabZ [Deltaproteobacteria bacterium]
MTPEAGCSHNTETELSFDIGRIMAMLPHRYPFLMVDRVISCIPGKRISAYKNVSINEPFFQGHFPGLPVMPGVLLLEALAQAGGLMVIGDWTQEKINSHIFLFTGMDNVKIRRQVRPGDRLDLECAIIRQKLQLWKIEAKALVDGKLAAQGELSAAIIDRREI